MLPRFTIDDCENRAVGYSVFLAECRRAKLKIVQHKYATDFLNLISRKFRTVRSLSLRVPTPPELPDILNLPHPLSTL